MKKSFDEIKNYVLKPGAVIIITIALIFIYRTYISIDTVLWVVLFFAFAITIVLILFLFKRKTKQLLTQDSWISIRLNQALKYLREFSLIFLGALLAFVYAQKDREKEESQKELIYTQSFIKDLEDNNRIICEWITWLTKYKDSANSAMTTYKHQPSNDSIIAVMGYEVLNAFGQDDHSPIERTWLQLQNTGSLALIKDTAFYNSILNYQRNIDLLNMYRTRYEALRIEGIKLESKIYDLDMLYTTRPDGGVTSSVDLSRLILKRDSSLFGELNNYCFHISWLIENDYIKLLKEQRNNIFRMLELIKTNYPTISKNYNFSKIDCDTCCIQL